MVWTVIKIEGYCLFSQAQGKKKEYFKLKKGKKFEFESAGMKDNPMYNPAPRPDWCKKEFPEPFARTPQYRCLESDCKHFGCCEADEDDEKEAISKLG